MSTKTGNQAIPLHQGLFTWPSDAPQLIGSRCIACGEVMFPKKSYCRNPDCKTGNTERILLSKRGTLYSYTIVTSTPPPPFDIIHNTAPYALGLVEMPEGITVLGLLTTYDKEQLSPGRTMEMIIDTMYTNDEGNDVVTYKFKPV